jgi:hypothetical protein
LVQTNIKIKSAEDFKRPITTWLFLFWQVSL